MIASLRGTVLAMSGSSIVVEVGGVGYAVSITPQHGLALRVGGEVFLWTRMIVREDDQSLFGFATSDELEVFDLLRSVSGVGPKSAMGVLAAMSAQQVASAIAADDDAAFRKVSGIGPKTAKLITVSLAGKLAVTTASAPVTRPTSITDDVVLALVGLGWPERVSVQAVDEAVLGASDAELSAVPALLRRALSVLGPAQLPGSAR
jgi:Holliday junction DNA helicase RuvA